MNRRRTPVTLEDVAEACGYSRATVSRVVNGDPRVNPAIARAVEKAVASLGYVSNQSARALAGGASMTVGLVFLESFRDLFRNPFWGEVVDSLSTVLWKANYQVAFLVNDGSERNRVRAYLRQRHVDAVIVMTSPNDATLIRDLVAEGLPCTVFGSPPLDLAIPAVEIGNIQMGAIAAERLFAKGSRRPVMIAGIPDSEASVMRVDGFLTRARELGLHVSEGEVLPGHFTEAGGAKAMRQLLASHPDLDAVFAASDRMALGAMEVLEDEGRRIPEDIKVIGVDGTAMGELARPKLTSIGADRQAIGHDLAELTLKALRGEEPSRIVRFPHLVERETA